MNKKWLYFSFPILLIFILVLVLIPKQKQIHLLVNDVAQTIETNQSTVGGLLDELGVQLRPEDRITPALENKISKGDTVSIQLASRYIILADGEEVSLYSAARVPLEIFAEAGIDVNEPDRLTANGKTVKTASVLPFMDSVVFIIHRSVQLNVLLADGQAQSFSTTADSLADALWEQQIPVYIHQQSSLNLDKPLNTTTSIQLANSQSYAIKVGNIQLEVKSSAATVGGVLAQVGLALQNLDYSIPDENEAAPEDGQIEVIRVEEEILEDRVLVPFDTLYEAMPEEELDTLLPLQTGEFGVNAQRIRVRYENGVEVSRVLEEVVQVKAPVPAIEGYGTLVNLRTLSTPHGVIEYYRAKTFWVTSYHAHENDPPWYGRVFCGGVPFEPGFVGVDLNYIPCGTRLYIPGFGFAVAMDTGYIRGAWLDIGFFDDEYEPWHRFETIYFLSPPPAADQIPYIIPRGTYYTP